jgi:hypothetical protein
LPAFSSPIIITLGSCNALRVSGFSSVTLEEEVRVYNSTYMI